MNARDDRAAACEIVDQMKLPHRSRRIERRRDQLRDQRFELARARTSSQRRAHHMVIEIEARIVFPECRGRRFDRALTEAPEHEKSFGKDRFQSRKRETLPKQQHPANHHEIRRAIHPQPRGVDGGNAFALVRGHRLR